MGVFRQFPYSNFHEMNMDEMIKIIKNMLEEWAQYHAEWDAWMTEINDDWSNYQEVMNEAWQNMQDFINNYFDNLDVQNEINNKITSMVNSGEFANIVEPFIPPRVTAWLSEHITQPVGVVIDTSLSVAGACADAKATGDAITENSVYNGIRYNPTKNLIKYPYLIDQIDSDIIEADECNIIVLENDGTVPYYYISLNEQFVIGDDVYLEFDVKGSTSNLTYRFQGLDGATDTTLESYQSTPKWEHKSFHMTLATNADRFRFMLSNTGIVYITRIIISKEPINYDYSVKTKVEKMEPLVNLIDGHITINQFDTMLKSAFAYSFSPVSLTFSVGFIKIDGTYDGTTSVYYAPINVQAGEIYRITTRHGSNLRSYVLVDSDNNVVDYYPPGMVGTVTDTVEITIPVNGVLNVNTFSQASTIVTKATSVVVATDSGGLANKTWYALGDSITAYTTGYASIISEQTGVNVTNGGRSGRGYMKPIDGETFVNRANLNEVYDIVTVFGSVNDMQYVPSDLGTETDSGTSTLGGCFNSVIDNLYASGNYHIGIISPIPQDSTSGNPANTTGTFAQYTELLEKVCRRRGVPYLDLWHCSNMQPWDASFASAYMQDITHPNTDGHKIFAPRIRAFIESL